MRATSDPVKAVERAETWLWTGPVGRVAAFCGDLGAAFGGWALDRVGLRRKGQ